MDSLLNQKIQTKTENFKKSRLDEEEDLKMLHQRNHQDYLHQLQKQHSARKFTNEMLQNSAEKKNKQHEDNQKLEENYEKQKNLFINYFNTKDHDAFQRREKNEKQVKHIEKVAYESKWKKEADHQALIDLNYEKRKQEWN